MTSKIVVNNIEADAGVSTVTFNSSIVANSTSTFSSGLNVTGGNVGIGTDSVTIGSYKALQVHSEGTNSYLVLTNNSSGTDAANDGVSFVLTGSDVNILNRESGNILLSTNGGERARVTSGGNVQISNGNLVFSTSGTGIDFSATADGGGTTTSELLDDYEEGYWTPTILNGGGNITVHRAYYIKIGRKVTIWINAYFDSGLGNALQLSLPFASDTSSTNASQNGIEGIGSCMIDNVDIPTGSLYPTPYIWSSRINFYWSGDNVSWVQMTASQADGGTIILAATCVTT